MTNRSMIKAIMYGLNISSKLRNKALIFSEFVTHKYCTEIYNKFLEKKISQKDAIYLISTVEV